MWRKKISWGKKIIGILWIKWGRKFCKMKMFRLIKRWCIVEEDEVFLFIYEFVRCGRIVYVWLLESLNLLGFIVEYGWFIFFGRVLFFSRVEVSLSFLLFGNVYVLYDFVDEEEYIWEIVKVED